MSRAPNSNNGSERSGHSKASTAQRPVAGSINSLRTRQPEVAIARPSKAVQPRSSNDEGYPLEYYPAYCHKISKTWFTWVKLTAYDVHHRLEARAGFHHSLQSVARKFRDKPQVLFFLNHPIQFVQVAGVVVNFEEHFQKFWLLTLDDSSGQTIDVICKKPEEDETAPAKAASLPEQALRSEQDDAEAVLRIEARKLAEVMTSSVAIGSVLQIKGTITLFHRNTFKRTINEPSTTVQQESCDDQPSLRQIHAQRIAILSTAAAELAFIAARDLFFETVLSNRWILSTRKQSRLQQEAYGDVQRHNARVVHRSKKDRHKEREKRDDEELSRVWEQEEALRAQHAAAAKEAAESLHTNCTPVSDTHPAAQSAAVDRERLALLKSAFG